MACRTDTTLCVIVLVSIAQLVLQGYAMNQCDFIKTTGANTEYFGLWQTGTNLTSCHSYSSVDSITNGARSAFTLSMLAGFAAGVMVLFEFLLCNVPCAGVLEGACYLCAWVLSGATFMLFGNTTCANAQFSCALAPASGYVIASVLCYAASGFLLCCAPQPDPLCKQCCSK